MKLGLGWVSKGIGAMPWRWRVLALLALLGWGFSLIGVWRSSRVVALEGLDIKSMPTVVELSSVEMNRRLAAMQRRSITPTIRCRRLALQQLGLITQIEPPFMLRDNSWLDKIQRTVTERAKAEAFYVAGRDTLYVLSKSSPAVKHELVHAWEDQESDRMQLAEKGTTDEQIALRAAIEGTAIIATHQNRATLNVGNNLDDNAWSLAYSLGPGHVERFGKEDPKRWLMLKPKSTYDIMYNKINTVPEELPLDSLGTATGCSDRIGPLAVLTAALAFGADKSQALRIAREWRGDRLDVWADGITRTVKWGVVFGDSLSTSDWQKIIHTTRTLLPERVIVYGLTTARTSASTSMDSTLAKRSPLTR